jgi:hypothetical protein
VLKDPNTNPNSAFSKAFGGKNMGSTFEKVARRVNKHLCKEYFQFQPVMQRVLQCMERMIAKAIKDHKITSCTSEQIEYFMQEEGAKIIHKYSKKQ